MSEERQTSTTAGRKTYLRAGVALAVFVGFIALVLHVDPADAYLWIKALHIIAVISWMAGLLYLPRLFIYHTDAPSAPYSRKPSRSWSSGSYA